MKKFIIKITKITLIIYISSSLLGLFLDYYIRHSKIFKSNFIFSQTLPKHLILGSSRSLTGIDTKKLSEQTKTKWFNLSIDDSPIEAHLLVYKILIEQNKNPEKLLLHYDNESNKTKEGRLFNKIYQFLPFIYESESIREYCKNSNHYWLMMAWPFYKYIYYNAEMEFAIAKILQNNNYQDRFDERGDYDYPKHIQLKNYDCQKPYNLQVDFKNPYLKSIENLAAIQHTNIILYTAPIYCTQSQVTRTDYINLSGYIQSPEYYANKGHCNSRGKEWVTDTLSKYMISIYK